MALPVVPKIGGSKGGGLKLKTDMTGVSGGKTKPGIKGAIKKNPGKGRGKMSGSK